LDHDFAASAEEEAVCRLVVLGDVPFPVRALVGQRLGAVALAASTRRRTQAETIFEFEISWLLFGDWLR